MTTFIAISGPSISGKTSIIDSLSSYQELSRAVFSPDFHEATWTELNELGIFSEFTEITSDSAYLCTYMHKLVDYYNNYIESHIDKGGLVFLDGCWLDFIIYAGLSLWYNRVIKSAQDELFNKILKFEDKISRIYLTRADDAKYPTEKFRIKGKITTFRMNRPLEIQLYRIAARLGNTKPLRYSEVSGDSLDIIDDLKELGYL